MSTFETIPDILEVTLRDGSYLIDFQFTAEDTATIAAALESVGFRWIEVGHGARALSALRRERQAYIHGHMSMEKIGTIVCKRANPRSAFWD